MEALLVATAEQQTIILILVAAALGAGHQRLRPLRVVTPSSVAAAARVVAGRLAAMLMVTAQQAVEHI
jgi:hypothetical protein